MKKYLILFIATFFAFNINAQTQYEDYWDGEIYMKFKDNSSKVILGMEDLRTNPKHAEIKSILQEANLENIRRPFLVLKTPVFDRTYQIYFQDKTKVDLLIRNLEQLDYVEYAERVPIMRSYYTPNDPGQANQYGTDKINAAEAWDLHKGGNAVVAIVDDAVFINHEDLSPNIWINPNEIPNNNVDDDQNGFIDDINGWDVANDDPNPNPPTASFDHGTHCAGIAGAATDNNKGVASIGFNNKLMAVKAKSDGSSGSGINAAWEGVSYAVAAGADVMSLSWGGSGSSSTNQNILINAYNLGIVVVAAAGNHGTDVEHYPAAYDHVIAVANTNQGDVKNGSSAYGDWVDISAPGTSIYSTLIGGGLSSTYGDNTGTSMACPMVAGLIGLMRSYNPFLSVDEIEACLKSSAVNINAINTSYADQLGAGRIDAYQALLCVAPNTAPALIVNRDNEGSICKGGTVQFFDDSYYAPTSWSWSFPGGIPSTSTEQNPVVYYPNGGTYDVTFSATNEFGTSTEIFPSLVTVEEAINEDIYYEDFESGTFSGWTQEDGDGIGVWKVYTVPNSFEHGDFVLGLNNYDSTSYDTKYSLVSPTISLYARDDATLHIDYSYRMALNAESDEISVLLSTDGGETYPHTLFQESENGSYNLATYVLINGSFQPTGENDWCGVGPAGAGCMQLDLSSFLGNENIRIKIQNLSREGNNFFIDNVRVSANCSNNTSPRADFEAEQTIGCNTLTTTFNDKSLGIPTSWNWTFQGGTPSSSTERSPSVTYDTPGVYPVTLEVSNASGTDTKTVASFITISDNTPAASFDIVNNFNYFSFTNTSTNGVNYNWDFGNGVSSTEENPSYTYPAMDDQYTVILQVENGCGVTTSSQVVGTTNTETIQGVSTFLAYPNPSTGQFRIELMGEGEDYIYLNVFNVLGQTVYSQTYDYSQGVLNESIGIDTNGTYFLSVSDENGNQLFKKIVIQK